MVHTFMLPSMKYLSLLIGQPIITPYSHAYSILPTPVSHSFRRISTINIESFVQDLSSNLVLNPTSSLAYFFCSFNVTLSMLLDKHAPTITKSGSHSNNSWFISYLQAFKSFLRRLERTYTYTSSTTVLCLKTATDRYHQLQATVKKRFYSSLVTRDPLIFGLSGKL